MSSSFTKKSKERRCPLPSESIIRQNKCLLPSESIFQQNKNTNTTKSIDRHVYSDISLFFEDSDLDMEIDGAKPESDIESSGSDTSDQLDRSSTIVESIISKSMTSQQSKANMETSTTDITNNILSTSENLNTPTNDFLAKSKTLSTHTNDFTIYKKIPLKFSDDDDDDSSIEPSHSVPNKVEFQTLQNPNICDLHYDWIQNSTQMYIDAKSQSNPTSEKQNSFTRQSIDVTNQLFSGNLENSSKGSVYQSKIPIDYSSSSPDISINTQFPSKSGIDSPSLSTASIEDFITTSIKLESILENENHDVVNDSFLTSIEPTPIVEKDNSIPLNIQKITKSGLENLLDVHDRCHLVLCIYHIFKDHQQFDIELTDGFHTIPAKLDTPLRKHLENGTFHIGAKLHIFASIDDNCTFASDGIKSSSEVILNLFFNSTKLASRLLSLGIQTTPFPDTRFIDIEPDGGLIPGIDIIVSRKSPIMYAERLRDGSLVCRTLFEEEEENLVWKVLICSFTLIEYLFQSLQ
ncbi:hypothetical protein BC833DRAFT_230599 [Globomyces pollinis-pini]|nr:hypothetical protein BC833DRAFT_230599 [Globomyces pollinis-pini]